MRAETPLSSMGADWFFMRVDSPAWTSQEWLSLLATLGHTTSTNRVPASTSRRDSRRHWPKVFLP